MNKDKIVFNINESEKIELHIPSEISKLFRYDEITIIYLKNKHLSYILYENDFIIEALKRLNNQIENALNEKLLLSKSITYDIGYIWNQYVNDDYF